MQSRNAIETVQELGGAAVEQQQEIAAPAAEPC